MTGVEEIETEISPMAARHGLAVYDIEMLSFGRPLLRVYLERQAENKGVTVGELESFAKVLIPFLNLKNLFPREGQVEVSSPGLQRRLRRPGHFNSAVGSPVSVTVKSETGKRTVKARLLTVTGDGITLQNPEVPFVPFADILQARAEPEVQF